MLATVLAAWILGTMAPPDVTITLVECESYCTDAGCDDYCEERYR